MSEVSSSPATRAGHGRLAPWGLTITTCSGLSFFSPSATGSRPPSDRSRSWPSSSGSASDLLLA
jgi:hypothetical protein